MPVQACDAERFKRVICRFPSSFRYEQQDNNHRSTAHGWRLHTDEYGGLTSIRHSRRLTVRTLPLLQVLSGPPLTFNRKKPTGIEQPVAFVEEE